MQPPHSAIWNAWNAKGGPKYPSEKVVQYTFRKFPVATRAKTRTLDLGCGSGVNSWFLTREGFPVVASDLSINGTQNTRARLAADNLPAVVVCADGPRLPFTDASFDYVICVRVLELIPDRARQDQLVGECSRLLRAGGCGLFMFASPLDYGHQHPDKSFGPFFPPDEAQARQMFSSRFSQVDFDIYQTTYENQRYAEHNFLVTFVK